jgi:hypothetical protein
MCLYKTKAWDFAQALVIGLDKNSKNSALDNQLHHQILHLQLWCKRLIVVALSGCFVERVG